MVGPRRSSPPPSDVAAETRDALVEGMDGGPSAVDVGSLPAVDAFYEKMDDDDDEDELGRIPASAISAAELQAASPPEERQDTLTQLVAALDPGEELGLRPEELAEKRGLWTDQVIGLLAAVQRTPPDIIRRRLDRFYSGGVSLSRLVDLWRAAARARWLRRADPTTDPQDGDQRYREWLRELERSRGGESPRHQDPDLLTLSSYWAVSVSKALVRGGAMLLRPDGESRLRTELNAAERFRHDALQIARQRGLTDEDGLAIARYFDIAATEWTESATGHVFLGLEPGEEGLVRIGAILGQLGRYAEAGLSEGDLAEFLDRARRVRNLIEAWESDPSWSRQDLELLRRRKGAPTLRAALEDLEEVVLAARQAREEIDVERRIARWTRVEETSLLAAHWEISPSQAEQRLRELLAEGREAELTLARQRVMPQAREAFEAELAPGGRFCDYDTSVADLLAEAWNARREYEQDWTGEDAREYIGALAMSGRAAVLQAIVDEVRGLVREGRLPEAFKEGPWTLADVSEDADDKGHGFRSAMEERIVQALSARDGVELEERDVRAEVERIRQKREQDGRGAEPCRRCFDGSSHWWPDDARFVAELRGLDEAEVAEWIGHRLLRGREDEVEEIYLQDRIEEQAIYRTESQGKPYVVLVLQGGGAKAAYQFGVFEALADAGLSPSWILGISSGALNAAVIAGNPPSKRRDRLEELWSRLTNRGEFSRLLPPALRPMSKVFGALRQLSWKRDFYRPHGLPPSLAADGTDAATSLYDNEPLRRMLLELVDFRRINREAEIHRRTAWSRRESHTPVRLTVGTTHVRTGEFVWWDSPKHEIGVEHVMASGAMPPGAPAVRIDGEGYWDGGVVGNNPLEPVLQEMLNGTLNGREVMVVFVDLWGGEDWEPTTFQEVQLRQTQLDFVGRVDASIDRFRTELLLEIERRRRRTTELPVDERPWRPRHRGFGVIDPRSLVLLRVENGRKPPLGRFDPMDFSADSIAQRRAQGREDMARALKQASWRDLVEDHQIGGHVFHFRAGKLISVSEAVDVEAVPEEIFA